jgi:hypothetical protein
MPLEAPLPPLPANDILPLDVPDDTICSPEDRTFLPASSSATQDLINSPCRTLEVEYKSWRNLQHPEDRAELARDIAAIANHGGGFVVFGFNEETLRPDDADPFRTDCTPDAVASIVQTFLDPSVACEIVEPVAADGVIHPVIRISGHGITPVCIRQNGPQVDGETLLERGAYYIRRHGPARSGRAIGVPRPQSAKVETPQDWAPLIRRCVRRDREALLGMLDAAIEGRTAPPDTVQRLVAWHRAARAAFLALVPRSPTADLLGRCHYALSYGFDLVRHEMLEHAQMPERLRHAVFDVRSRFRSGWNMFDPPYRRGVQARFMSDPATGDEELDFLEAAWLRARTPTETADFWRVSPNGLATIIRGFAEDVARPDVASIRPGACLSPELLAQEVAELVCHASALARLFSGVRRVVFRCEWWGLSGRTVYDPTGQWSHREPALSDHCIATTAVPISRLAQAWPEVVAQLMAPPLRAVEPDLHLGPDWVRDQAPRWAEGPG